MANRSTFPTAIDTFIEHLEMSASDKTLVQRYQELKLKALRTPTEEDELATLTNQLRSVLITAEDFNKLQDAIKNTQSFFRDSVDGYIQQKQTEFQAEVDKFTHKGEYSPSAAYSKKNTVTLNGEAYVCLKDVTGVSPDPTKNTDTWTKIAQKGEKGDRGASGTGLRFVGTWVSTKQYFMNDAVQFDGNVFACLKDNVGNAPNQEAATEFWSLAIAKGDSTRTVVLRNNVVVSNSTESVSIGIPTYNPLTDSLIVIKNTATLSEGLDYQVISNGETINSLVGTWDGSEYPITFQFLIIKNVLAEVPVLNELHLDFVKKESDYAKAQGDYAKDQGDYAKQVADENKTVLLTPVATFADIATAYPTPEYGWKVQTTSDNKFYRYQNNAWELVESVDGSLLVDIQNQITKQAAIKRSLQRGLQVVNVTQDTPVNVLNLDGKTVVNHVPLFDSGLWTIHANAIVNSPNKVTLNSATAGEEYAYIDVVVKPSATYTFKANGLFDISLRDSAKTFISEVGTQVSTKTFTTTSTTAFVRIYAKNTTANTDYVAENVTLTEGTSAKEFVANVKGITNPTIENTTTGDSITLLSTFHEGDKVYMDSEGQPRVIRKKREVVLGGDLDWRYLNDFTGYKCVISPISNVSSTFSLNEGSIVKYNGSMLFNKKSALSEKDQFAIGEYTGVVAGSEVVISIADTDSGWGETYTPTADEIKAYFLGWRMMNNSVSPVNGVPVPYDGTGAKAWHFWNDNGTYGGITSTLPTTQVSINSKWQPYRLIYDLATPVEEPVPHIGSLTLQKGDNQVDVTEGRIVRERVTPVLSNGWYYVNSTVHTTSWLKHKDAQIVGVYENGEPFNKAIITATGRNSEINIKESDFNPSAVYHVDYIPLEPYKVTAHTNPIDVQYQTNLGSVVGELVNDVADVDKRMSVVERDMVRKNAGVTWITPTLLNGWRAYDTARFAKFSIDPLGIVRIQGSIQAGTLTSGTVLFILPKGFRPSSAQYYLVVNGSSNVAKIAVSDSGIVNLYGDAPSNAILSLDGISFKAEQ